MKKIIEWFGGGLVKDLLGGLDKLFTSKEEKIKAENVIKQILIEKINKFLATHQQKREKARDQLDKFLLKD